MLALKQATTTIHKQEGGLARALPLLISSSSNVALVRRLRINLEASAGRLLATTLTKGAGTTTGVDRPEEEDTRAVVERQTASWATATATATGEEGKGDR